MSSCLPFAAELSLGQDGFGLLPPTLTPHRQAWLRANSGPKTRGRGYEFGLPITQLPGWPHPLKHYMALGDNPNRSPL